MQWEKIKGLFLIIAMSFAFTSPVLGQSGVQIYVNQIFVSKPRVSVGEEVTVGLRFEWAETGAPVTSAQVSINGVEHWIWHDGWLLIKEIENNVMKKTYNVDYIRVASTYYSWEMLVPAPEVIFDKVKIELYPECERINIGSPPKITNYSYYMYDYESFEGTIKLNVTGPVNNIGTKSVSVDEIWDEKYGVHTFESTVVSQTWDKVNVVLYKDKPRYNVDQEADIGYQAYYESDLAKFYGTVEINDTTKKDVVGEYHYTVDSIKDNINEVTLFESNVLDVIYDKIKLNITVEDDRISVGEEARINFTGTYLYDNSEFLGNLRFNHPLASENVGKKTLEVRKIEDNRFFLDHCEANSIDVIWDSIKVDINVDDTRVDVGETVEIIADAYYEYDNQRIPEEDYTMNAMSKMMSKVGNFTFKADKAYGAQHDISAVNCDGVNIIWDQIEFVFQPQQERFILETGVKPRVEARYIYDGEEYNGEYKLNNHYPTYPGKYLYKVISINDSKYGLTVFNSNEQEYIFDNVLIEEQIENKIPGSITYVYRINYESDYLPIENAIVLIDGQQCSHTVNGLYVLQSKVLLPKVEKNVQIWVQNYLIEEKQVNELLLGNIGVSALILIIFTIGGIKIIQIIKSRKSKTERIQDIDDEEKYEYLEYEPLPPQAP
jgi:hypothetical protein